MKHFLITRFNLKGKKNLKGNRIFNPLSEEWLDKRFKIFESYCLPSVINQTNKNFIWLVCFDIDTPEIYHTIIKNLEHTISNFAPVFVDGFGELENTIQEVIQEKLSPNDDFIITTRIDNDDIIHQDFISTIQSSYVAKHNTLIDLELGYQLILDSNITSIREFKLPYNPFLSLVESSSNFNTIISKEHRYWKSLPDIKKYKHQPLWIQVVHDQNLLNRKRNYLKKVIAIDYSSFGMKSELKLEDTISIKKFNRQTYFLRVYNNLKTFFK